MLYCKTAVTILNADGELCDSLDKLTIILPATSAQAVIFWYPAHITAGLCHTPSVNCCSAVPMEVAEDNSQVEDSDENPRHPSGQVSPPELSSEEEEDDDGDVNPDVCGHVSPAQPAELQTSSGIAGGFGAADPVRSQDELSLLAARQAPVVPHLKRQHKSAAAALLVAGEALYIEDAFLKAHAEAQASREKESSIADDSMWVPQIVTCCKSILSVHAVCAPRQNDCFGAGNALTLWSQSRIHQGV